MLKQMVTYVFVLYGLSAATVSLADEIGPRQDSHGVSYVNGGIGSEEVEALQAYRKQFNLYFIFSEGKIGRVIDSVDLSIRNAQNQEVFQLNNAAPRLLLSLPAGKYQAVASYQGHQQRYVFEHAVGKQQRIILNWKHSEATEEFTERADPGSDLTTPE